MKGLLLSSLCLFPLSNGFVPSTSTPRFPPSPAHLTKATRQIPSSSLALNVVAPEALQEAWTSYNNALEANPLLVKSVTAGVILGAADLAGQAIEDINSGKKVGQDINFARAARFAFFGLVLQAVCKQHRTWLRCGKLLIGFLFLIFLRGTFSLHLAMEPFLLSISGWSHSTDRRTLDTNDSHQDSD
jgi:hypothetical protein